CAGSPRRQPMSRYFPDEPRSPLCAPCSSAALALVLPVGLFREEACELRARRLSGVGRRLRRGRRAEVVTEVALLLVRHALGGGLAAVVRDPGRHVDHSARQLDEAGGVRWHAIVWVTPLAMRAQALVRAAVSVSSSFAPSTARHALRPSNSMHVSHRTPAMRKLDQTTKLTRPRRTAAPSHDVHFMRASLPFRTGSAKPWGCGRMGGIMRRAGGRHRLWLGALGLLLGGATPGLAGDDIAAPSRVADLVHDVQGFGDRATGGQGGEVYWVTTLADGGPGSLRSAAEDPSRRWIRFGVSGEVHPVTPIAVASDKTIDGGGA